MSRPRPVVAIDGPAGAGKSTVALKVATHLGFVLVDTGALYRGVARLAADLAIDWTDGTALGVMASEATLTFVSDARGTPLLHINGVDRSGEIRTPEMSMGASDVSRHPEVRAALLGMQRELGAQGGVVLEGRDIGTVVFPDAEVKIFLTASARTRASRRVADLHARGMPAELEQTLAEVEARDHQDSTRPVAPLKPADDAILLDTTGMDIEAVVDAVLELVPGTH